MTTAGTTDLTALTASPSVAVSKPLTVYSCRRLGLTANPPSFSLTHWLLPGRRR